MLWKWNEKRQSLWGVYRCINGIRFKYGQNEVGDIENKLKSDKAYVEFLDKFKSQNESYICNDLLNCDITTQEGINYTLENKLFTEICQKMVSSATLIVENILNEDR